MLPSKIDQMKVSHETENEANFGFGRALMPSYLGMCPLKAAFFSFRRQPWFRKFASLFSCFSRPKSTNAKDERVEQGEVDWW